MSDLQPTRLGPVQGSARMLQVVLTLAWVYLLNAGPVIGMALIALGVLTANPILRYAGALVLGLTGAILLNDLVQGLCRTRFPDRFLATIRACPRRRLAMIAPFALLLIASVAIAAWASFALLTHLAHR